MTRVVFAIPGELAARTGGYGYDRRILQALPAFGFDVVHLPLANSFPNPAPADIFEALASMRSATRPGDVLLVDGLAYGALPVEAIGALKNPVVALCHH